MYNHEKYMSMPNNDIKNKPCKFHLSLYKSRGHREDFIIMPIIIIFITAQKSPNIVIITM